MYRVHLLHKDGGQERRNIYKWLNKFKIYLKDKQQQKKETTFNWDREEWDGEESRMRSLYEIYSFC